MKAKTMAIFLAITLMLSMMAVLPTQATTEASYDMERSTDGILPDGFTVTPGESGATVSWVDTEIAGNATKKLKIEHTENTKTTVQVTATAEETSYAVVSFYWSFFLESLSEGNGVKLKKALAEHTDWTDYIQETAYFTKTDYTWWRQMMVYDAKRVYDAVLTVTFEGKGTLYLDDVRTVVDAAVINGDFEGLSGDGVLAGTAEARWKATSTTITHTTTEPTTQGWYFVETKDGNYLQGVNLTTAYPVYYNLPSKTPSNFKDGKQYTVSALYKSGDTSDAGLGLITTYGLTGPAGFYTSNWAKGTTSWGTKTYTVLYNSSKNSTNDSARPEFQFRSRNGNSSVYLDNIAVYEETEKVEMDKTVSGENATTATVTYSLPLFSLEDTTLTSGTKSARKATAVAALFKKDGTALQLSGVKIAANLQGEVKGSTNWGVDNGTDAWDVLGLVPASDSISFEIPDDGNEYIVKFYIWDGVNGMKPATENDYEYTITAGEATA